jgi:molybdenum cofactor cytidylyltransferase
MNEPGQSSLGAVLLAAGGSTRLGRSKQLLDIAGQPLVARQAQLLAGLGFARFVVVTGSQRDSVEAALAGFRDSLCFNPRWQEGMGTSLAVGIAAMPERVRGALVLLCDQWRIGAPDLHRLVQAWTERPQAAVVAGADGYFGPPAIFPRSLFQRLMALSGDRGARRLLERFGGEVVEVSLPHAAFDIDTEADVPA